MQFNLINPHYGANTAIIITTDEGGGYFDIGAIQNLDFFGDGPRIPLLIVSPYAKKGYLITHKPQPTSVTALA